MLDATKAFALLWDQSAGKARLFHDLRGVVTRLQDISSGPEWLAGGLSYEAGMQQEPRLSQLAKGKPFLWLGRFASMAEYDEEELATLLAPFNGPARIGSAMPTISRAEWMRAVDRAKAYIAAGDIYQANLSFQAQVDVQGHPLHLFRRLFSRTAAPHGGVVHDGDGRWWISLSPELFFRLDNGQLTAKPMKGTYPRQPQAAKDGESARALAADPKNRAENLMITDLLRNDLARVSVPGSVRVPKLFQVETYPSVHQLTSTVTARLRDGLNAAHVLQALFPCGSITGAPKVRAMQIIAELEPAPRGIYCGSIGWISPDRQSAHFNVAIRTLDLRGGQARLGLGAGIVADSDAADEWAECLTKSRFLHASAPRTLIETMRVEQDGRIPRLKLHLDRLQASAMRFQVPFNRALLEKRLILSSASAGRRLRLLLSAKGEIALQFSALPPMAQTPAIVSIAPLPVSAHDWRLAHKSSDRHFYDETRKAHGSTEVIFIRPDGWLTEGSFTNIFVEKDGMLLTPPLEHGLLPGVLRAELLESGMAREAPLRPEDLKQGLLLGNSLRGLFPATLKANSWQN